MVSYPIVRMIKLICSYFQLVEILTCVIGAKCAEGCVIISDTRVMREFEATNESKIHVLWDRVVTSGAGNAAILDNFAADLEESKVPETPNFAEVVKTIEDIAFALHGRYRPRLGSDYDFQALVMGLEKFDSGDPFIRLVHGEGISEAIENYAIIGHGSPYVNPLFKLLYDNMLTVTELAVLGYFSISTIVHLGLDQTVGVGFLGPETIVLKPGEKPTFLNPFEKKDFSTCLESLSALKFRYSLAKKVWSKLPQAYENIDPNLF